MARRGKTVEEGRYDGYRMFLRNQRIRMGYTQEALAFMLKCHRGTVTQYERGVREPDYDTLKRIKKLLDVDDIGRLLEKYKYVDGVFVGDNGNKEIGIQ